MAKAQSVWGIDIGNASLKAVRCRLDDAPNRIVAEAFDYIEYPKILTQPGAEPAELVRDALAQFQSRNNLRGDQVAIAISGQSGLARFIKLPPVESKRIPDIVRYEARQQIPFDLNDVIWDYQRMGGGMEEEGFVLEAEVGLFAIKRDQVFRALEPFRKVGIEVDWVQLTPLALYNFLVFDQLQELPPPEDYDPEDPPPSYVVLSMGTDATDLVVTNGYRVWQRSIPLGGSHFTKALTKELKLTFAKAEHLKRNAASADDPKAVYQAMRPVFNDLLTEIQRSITYFTSIDRTATIGKIVTLGNAMKLPGLRRYLTQNLGYEVVRLDSFRGLVGPEVVRAPAFKENQLCFGACYGLALQALGKASLKTNLLPTEIVKDRLIREKKPWAVAAAAVLLLAFTISFIGLSRAMGKMSEGKFGDSEQKAEQTISDSGKWKQAEADAKRQFEETDKTGRNLVTNVEERTQVLELLRAMVECLPNPPGERPKDISLREELHVTSVECQKMEKLENWFALVQQNGWYEAPADAEADAGPTGPGYVVSLTGYHYHNSPTPEVGDARFVQGAQFVRETLMKDLQSVSVLLPKREEEGEESVSMKDLGIGYPVLVNPGRIYAFTLPNPNAKGPRTMMGGSEDMSYPSYGASVPGSMSGSMPGGGYGSTMAPARTRFGAKPAPKDGEEEEPIAFELQRFDFLVQFVWQPPSLAEETATAEPTGIAQPTGPMGTGQTL